MADRHFRRSMMIVVAALAATAGAPASAQTIPTIDTEDAALGSADTISGGRVHPTLSFDLRNGDFARGAYDDDRADLDRLPVHAQIGVAIDLMRDADGKASGWLVLRSSNGIHAPNRSETASPRGWYESNNLAALVLSPAKGSRIAAVYTIKTSPNGVSDTTHEASLSFAYDGDDALGMLAPTVVATIRPKGDHGLFARVGVEPDVDLSSREGGPKLSLPIVAGIGAHGFYGRRSGDRTYLSVGAAIEQAFLIDTSSWTARLEALALIRDERLARLSGPDGETGTVVPLITLSVSMAY